MPPSPTQPETLYNGHDLANAAAQSRVHRSLPDSLRGVRNATAILGDMLANRLSRDPTPFEFVTASGTIAGTDTILTAAYAGTGANRDWCLASVFENGENGVEPIFSEAASSTNLTNRVEPIFSEAASSANFVFADGIGSQLIEKTGLKALILPAWVKQRLRVQPDWALQLKSMRRGTRQEVARILRKYSYTTRLTSDRADFESFYANLYKPYATRRFGDGALLVDRDKFLTECRRGILLQLLHQQSVVGTSLLRPVGGTLAIVWSALDPQAEPGNTRGAADALDYFSLLYAQLKGCRWLDFGPSRPDLYDGALRYKSKWGADVTSGFARQTQIYFACGDKDGAELEVLQRHAFVCQSDGQLSAVAFVDGGHEVDALRRKVAGLIVPGVERLFVVAQTKLSVDARAIIAGVDPRVKLIEAASFGEAVAAIRG